MRQAFREEFVRPLTRVWHSPWSAYRYATDHKFVEAITAERKVFSRIARDLRWRKEAFDEIVSNSLDLILHSRGKR